MDEFAVPKSYMALHDSSTTDVTFYSGDSANHLTQIQVSDVILRDKDDSSARSVVDSLIQHDADIRDTSNRLHDVSVDLQKRAYQADLDDVSTRLSDTRRLADFNSSTLNTLYDPHTKVVTGNGFKVLTSGNNVAGIMAGSADGIEFQTSGGNGYVNITVDDVRIPVNSGGGDEFTTMKRINSDLEDCIAEKDELRREYDKTKETVEKVINIDDQTGRSIYAENVITKTATVDTQLTVDTVTMKKGKFEPEDIDGNLVPARFQNVYIGNTTDVQTKILNNEQNIETIQNDLQKIGVGEKIYDGGNGNLFIEADNIDVHTISSRKYIMLNDSDEITGYIAADNDSDFVFKKSTSQGTEVKAAIECSSVKLSNGTEFSTIEAYKHDEGMYARVANFEVADNASINTATFNGDNITFKHTADFNTAKITTLKMKNGQQTTDVTYNGSYVTLEKLQLKSELNILSTGKANIDCNATFKNTVEVNGADVNIKSGGSLKVVGGSITGGGNLEITGTSNLKSTLTV